MRVLNFYYTKKKFDHYCEARSSRECYLQNQKKEVVIETQEDSSLQNENERTFLLLVDDDETIRRIFCDVLRRCNFEVVEAEGVGAAIRALLEFPEMRMVLCDNMLADGTARHLLEHPVAINRRLIVAIATGGLSETEREYFEQRGVPMLSKPFGINELRLCVETMRSALES